MSSTVLQFLKTRVCLVRRSSWWHWQLVVHVRLCGGKSVVVDGGCRRCRFQPQRPQQVRQAVVVVCVGGTIRIVVASLSSDSPTQPVWIVVFRTQLVATLHLLRVVVARVIVVHLTGPIVHHLLIGLLVVYRLVVLLLLLLVT